MIALDTYVQFLSSIICSLCYVFHQKLDGRLNVHLLMMLQKIVELIFFSRTLIKDNVIDVELMGRPFLVLTKINNEQRPRTNSLGRQSNDNWLSIFK